MIIYVNTPSGWTIGVNLRSSDTITDLKVRIEDEEWIPQGTVIKLHQHGISSYRSHVQIGNI